MKFLAATALALVALTTAAHGQSMNVGGRYHGKPPSSGVHWCTWSAATVCAAWRARGGKFICPPGNMSMSCRLQRRDVR
jgi:hypothetical protein